jgi:transposase-like protein/IS1 family transposase
MTCHSCRIETVKAGKGRNQVQRYKCQQCGKRFTEPQEKPFGADVRLPHEKVCMILNCLVEGNSVRATARLCDVQSKTVLAMLVLAGKNCERIMGRKVRNVQVKDVQCDEIWGFVQKKEAHQWPEEVNDNSVGDAYTFVAIERDSKLVLNFALGRRDQQTTNAFIEGLRDAVAPDQAFQLSTDGFTPYVGAVDATLAHCVDFAQLVKVYATPREGEQRYSPAEVVDARPKPILGNPDPARICTSHVERQNLTMRMQIRRLTRLTNAFSKKLENLWAALCLYFAWYNFVRIHQTLRITPAMTAGISDRVWDIRDLVSPL